MAIGLLVGCGGGDGPQNIDSPSNPPLAASFTPSGATATADRVRLVGGVVQGNLITLNVAIGGPTTSDDLYSFAFDLVLGDPGVARYEGGSAGFGNALTLGGGQGQSVLASQQGDRVVVGVSKTGGGAGNQVTPAEATVVSLVFRLLKAGSTEVRFAGSPGNPGGPAADPQALDSSGAPVNSVNFDAGAAWLTGS